MPGQRPPTTTALMVQGVVDARDRKATTLTRRALGTPSADADHGHVDRLRVRCHGRHRLGGRRRGRGGRRLDGPLHRRFLSDWYAGEFPARVAGLVFQANPRTGDRRISGTAASPARRRGTRTPGSPACSSPTRWWPGWGGIPVVWSGDELAQPNDPGWADEPGHAADNRWASRPQLDAGGRAPPRPHHPSPAGAFAGLAHLARARALPSCTRPPSVGHDPTGSPRPPASTPAARSGSRDSHAAVPRWVRAGRAAPS